MTSGPYQVAEVEDAGKAVCDCENCGWEGTADLVEDIHDCALTPGDVSPVGRCPDCDGLVYLARPLRDQASEHEIPEKVKEALLHIHDLYPEVTQVFFGVDQRWLYCGEAFQAPSFDSKLINESLLEEAADAVQSFPAAFSLDVAGA